MEAYNYILQCYIIFQEIGKLFPNIPHQETLLDSMKRIFILFNKIPVK